MGCSASSLSEHNVQCAAAWGAVLTLPFSSVAAQPLAAAARVHKTISAPGLDCAGGDAAIVLAAFFFSLATVRINGFTKSLPSMQIAAGKSLVLGALAVAYLLYTASITTLEGRPLTSLWEGWANPVAWGALVWSAVGPGAIASYFHVKVSAISHFSSLSLPVWCVRVMGDVGLPQGSQTSTCISHNNPQEWHVAKFVLGVQYTNKACFRQLHIPCPCLAVRPVIAWLLANALHNLSSGIGPVQIHCFSACAGLGGGAARRGAGVFLQCASVVRRLRLVDTGWRGSGGCGMGGRRCHHGGWRPCGHRLCPTAEETGVGDGHGIVDTLENTDCKEVLGLQPHTDAWHVDFWHRISSCLSSSLPRHIWQLSLLGRPKQNLANPTNHPRMPVPLVLNVQDE